MLITVKYLSSRRFADRESSTFNCPFATMANGIDADRSAVEVALTAPGSNGSEEGNADRVKMIKRQGYVRARLDLLQHRVLAAA